MDDGQRGRLMPVHLYTGSAEKREQYRYLLGEHGLALAPPTELPAVPEPQVDGSGADAERILVTLPLTQLAEAVDRAGLYPMVVDDTMLFIEHFNRRYDDEPVLPGPDTKRWWRALGAEGLLKVMGATRRRRARYVCQLGVLLGPGRQRVFRAVVDGTIAYEVDPTPPAADDPPGDFRRNTFFHGVFVPDGAPVTLARLDQPAFLAHDYRRRCVAAAAPELRTTGAPPGIG